MTENLFYGHNPQGAFGNITGQPGQQAGSGFSGYGNVPYGTGFGHSGMTPYGVDPITASYLQQQLLGAQGAWSNLSPQLGSQFGGGIGQQFGTHAGGIGSQINPSQHAIHPLAALAIQQQQLQHLLVQQLQQQQLLQQLLSSSGGQHPGSFGTNPQQQYAGAFGASPMSQSGFGPQIGQAGLNPILQRLVGGGAQFGTPSPFQQPFGQQQYGSPYGQGIDPQQQYGSQFGQFNPQQIGFQYGVRSGQVPGIGASHLGQVPFA